MAREHSSTSWQAFISKAIAGEPVDPFVRMLEQQIADGARVIQIHITQRAADNIEYVVLLERRKQLAELRLTHSQSFTRWSLASGARMASHDEEAIRFALLARERLEPIEQGIDAHSFASVLVEALRILAPPRTAALLAKLSIARPGLTHAVQEAIRAVQARVAGLARDLGARLQYSVDESAEILDLALEQLLGKRFPES